MSGIGRKRHKMDSDSGSTSPSAASTAPSVPRSVKPRRLSATQAEEEMIDSYCQDMVMSMELETEMEKDEEQDAAATPMSSPRTPTTPTGGTSELECHEEMPSSLLSSNAKFVLTRSASTGKASSSSSTQSRSLPHASGFGPTRRTSSLAPPSLRRSRMLPSKRVVTPRSDLDFQEWGRTGMAAQRLMDQASALISTARELSYSVDSVHRDTLPAMSAMRRQIRRLKALGSVISQTFTSEFGRDTPSSTSGGAGSSKDNAIELE